MVTDKEVEEAFEKWVDEYIGDDEPHWSEVNVDKDSFIAGAKWMQEKMKEEREKSEKSDYEHDLQFNSCI